MPPMLILILTSGLWVCVTLFVWSLCMAASRPRPHMTLKDGRPLS